MPCGTEKWIMALWTNHGRQRLIRATASVDPFNTTPEAMPCQSPSTAVAFAPSVASPLSAVTVIPKEETSLVRTTSMA